MNTQTEAAVAVGSSEEFDIKPIKYVELLQGSFSAGDVLVVDDGAPTYLDGIECQYAIHMATGKTPNDTECVGFVFDREHAILLAKALMSNADANRASPREETTDEH